MKKAFSISVLSLLCGCAMQGATSAPPSTPVFFKPNSAVLDQAAQKTITLVAQAAAAKPGAPVTVVGTTEDKGDTGYTNALSEQRAQAVAAQLVADGVEKSRLRVYGSGAVDKPHGLNKSQGARRVLISIGD